MVNFSQIERLAFWKVYNGKCIYCSNPIIRISEMQIDHIFYKDLKSYPDEFIRIKKEYNLPEDYNLDEYYNLVCSCGTCNRDKSNKLREKSAMLTYYSIARENEPKIKALTKEFQSKLESSKLLTQLKIILEQGFLEPKEVLELINITKNLIWQVNNPIVVTLTLYDEEDESKYTFSSPSEYWQWCDQCLTEIITKINETLTCLFAVCDESRDGEGYGVRFAFWGLNWRDFNEKFLPKINNWELQEVLPFEDIYEESAEDLFFKLKK